MTCSPKPDFAGIANDCVARVLNSKAWCDADATEVCLTKHHALLSTAFSKALEAAHAQGAAAEKERAKKLVDAVRAHLSKEHSHYLIPYALLQALAEYEKGI